MKKELAKTEKRDAIINFIEEFIDEILMPTLTLFLCMMIFSLMFLYMMQ